VIGLGANLPGPGGETPKENLLKALDALKDKGIRVRSVSPFYKSAPVPASDQPWYVNAVAVIETTFSAKEVLSALHEIEEQMGRHRRIRDEARMIDLDLLDYNGLVRPGGEGGPALPHPRMHKRAFVLQPLCDLADDWRHPVLDKTAAELLEGLGGEDTATRM